MNNNTLITQQILDQSLDSTAPVVIDGRITTTVVGRRIDFPTQPLGVDRIQYVQIAFGGGDLYVGNVLNDAGNVTPQLCVVRVPGMSPASKIAPGTLVLAKVSQ